MQGKFTRYYGLDALRACMMLLGILFHLSMPYTGVPFRGHYVTAERSLILDLVLLFHLFRMPTFFLLSGFFSALLYERRGFRNFLLGRAKRVGLIWIVALAVLSGPMAVIGIYNHFASQGGAAWQATWAALASWNFQSNWLPNPPLHLWFLEYLMCYCILAAMTTGLFEGFLPRVDRVTEAVLSSKFRIVALALPTSATLFFMPFAVVPYPAGLVPWFGVFVTYGWFYAAGWLIFRRRDLLNPKPGRTAVELTGLLIFLVVSVILVQRRAKVGVATSAIPLDMAIALNTALMVWAIVFLLITAFSRIRPDPRLPYLADASYWLYLAHYPPAVLMPALLRSWQVSPVVKVVFSCALICAVELLIYNNFIRYTVIGTMLNGARIRPSSNPVEQPAPAVQINVGDPV
jgi:peptidoglycan/LPS O-acetylase OafA/YrhL